MGDWSDDEKPAAKPAPRAKSSGDDWGDSEKKSGGSGGPVRRTGGSGADSKEIMMIDSKMVGRIVGKGGETVNQLKADFNVVINIDREEDDDGQKKVEISGKEGDVKDAMEAIQQKIDGDRGPRKEQNMYDNDGDAKEVLMIDPKFVGRIVGKGGETIKSIQDDYNVKVNIDKEEDDDGKKKVEVCGAEEDVKKAVEFIQQKIGGGGGDRGQGGGMYDNEGDSKEVLMIDNKFVGRIVGKGGETINSLQSGYSVKINIDKEEDDDGKKKVEVCGSEDDVRKAIAAIQQKISSSGGDGDDKPREAYVPPELTNDETEMFGAGISAGINFDKFDDIEVAMTGNGAENIKPLTTFNQANLRPLLEENVFKCGYTKPTPIQKFAIQIISQNRDLMGCAQTGSGKTAAFLLPILNRIMIDGDTAEMGQPQALIVAPVRELVMQIHAEARKFSSRSIIKNCIAYGGITSSYQSDAISNGCHILVATPGRLMDFVNRGVISFASLKFLVLDEADRMLDMGFNEKIKEITTHPTLNKEKCQTLMFSATFPEEIQRLAGTYLRDYIFLTVGVVGGASEDVDQSFLEVTRYKKRGKLTEILDVYCNSSEEDRILVFVETKKTADFLASLLSETKISSTSIHGDRLQREREEALRDFRTGKRKVLIATSVAARGLDIKGVTHVINYDLPKDVQDYVHRIGRTGRVGNRGKATSFYDPENDSAIASDLARILKEAKQPIPEFLGEAGSSYSNDGFGGQDIRSGVTVGNQQEDDGDW